MPNSKIQMRQFWMIFKKFDFLKTYLKTGKIILVYSWGLHSPTRNNTGSNTAAKTSWLRISCSSKGHVCWNQSFWNIIKKNWLKKVISSWHCLQNYQKKSRFICKHCERSEQSKSIKSILCNTFQYQTILFNTLQCVEITFQYCGIFINALAIFWIAKLVTLFSPVFVSGKVAAFVV